MLYWLKQLHDHIFMHKNLSIMNMPYEMFLTIQMNLTCRKDRIHNLLQENKIETCSKEQVTTVQDEE